jgi:hypothetical protein
VGLLLGRQPHAAGQVAAAALGLLLLPLLPLLLPLFLCSLPAFLGRRQCFHICSQRWQQHMQRRRDGLCWEVVPQVLSVAAAEHQAAAGQLQCALLLCLDELKLLGSCSAVVDSAAKGGVMGGILLSGHTKVSAGKKGATNTAGAVAAGCTAAQHSSTCL